ncbi:MAG TPA: lysylphosphatidylglycerol synthase transmembrane domain-containing protein [Candidatus Nitrosocosmicus sp.]|nr:lysylphosphatidylglycerol synthase transmembrane domain-containing protein [Candidatus Nitrosocosmicus sp.]
MRTRIILSSFLLVLVSFLLYKTINFNEVSKLLYFYNKYWFLLFFSLASVIILLKTLRFRIILNGSNIQISFLQTLKVFSAGQVTSSLPGGEIMRGVLLKKENDIPISKSSGPIITQAYLDFLSSLVIVLIGSLFLRQFIIPSLITTFIFVFLIIVFTHPPLFAFIWSIFPEKRFVKLAKVKTSLIQKSMRRSVFLPNSNKINPAFTTSFVIALLTQIIGGILLFFISYSFGILIFNPVHMFVFSASSVIQAMTAFAPGGLGFTEGGMTGLLVLLDIPLAKAIAMVVVYRISTFLFPIAIGTIILLFYYSKILLHHEKK